MTDRKDGHFINQATLSSGFFIGKIMFEKLINYFKKPPAKNIAQEDLEEAHRQYLKHTSAAAYHNKVSEFYADSITRLGVYIKKA